MIADVVAAAAAVVAAAGTTTRGSHRLATAQQFIHLRNDNLDLLTHETIL